MFQTILLQMNSEGIMSVLPFIAMVGVLYFFMIRPQVTRQKKEKKFQSEIKKGLKVVTTGGIHGRVVEINNDGTLLIETGAGKLRIERASISMELTAKYSADVKK
ncbi:MAG: preprotein translocase subunit YajC [Tenacibaculum sp.]|nr:preprotein translocase subunit YajC [Tenacibaculum sp.]